MLHRNILLKKTVTLCLRAWHKMYAWYRQAIPLALKHGWCAPLPRNSCLGRTVEMRLISLPRCPSKFECYVQLELDWVNLELKFEAFRNGVRMESPDLVLIFTWGSYEFCFGMFWTKIKHYEWSNLPMLDAVSCWSCMAICYIRLRSWSSISTARRQTKGEIRRVILVLQVLSLHRPAALIWHCPSAWIVRCFLDVPCLPAGLSSIDPWTSLDAWRPFLGFLLLVSLHLYRVMS